MPAEVLVMCAECGRPQYPTRPTCVACGKPLPTPPPAPPSAPTARDLIIDQYEPFLEGMLGRGRSLALSRKRLEWFPGGEAPKITFELSRLRSVGLRARPVYEALFAALLAGLGIALVPGVITELVCGALGVLSLVACFAQRRYALRLTNDQGQQASLYLGLGTPNAPVTQSIKSIWQSFGPELKALGVAVEDAK